VKKEEGTLFLDCSRSSIRKDAGALNKRLPDKQGEEIISPPAIEKSERQIRLKFRVEVWSVIKEKRSQRLSQKATLRI